MIIRYNKYIGRLCRRSSYNREEIDKFSGISDWWDMNGSQKPLHAYNILRLDYMKKYVYRYMNVHDGYHYMKHLSLLDVGCGPGIFTEVSIM